MFEGYFCQKKHLQAVAKVTPLYLLAATLMCFTGIIKGMAFVHIMVSYCNDNWSLFLLFVLFAIW